MGISPIEQELGNSGQHQITLVSQLNELISFPGASTARSHDPEGSFSVFVHSANRGFSLGSGSSRIVHECVLAEKSRFGRSHLEIAIQRIRRTAVGQAAQTAGAEVVPSNLLPEAAEGHDVLWDQRRIRWNIDQRYHGPWFDGMVHAILPGPRARDWYSRVEGLLESVLGLVEHGAGLRNVELTLPIFGINNFGYPPQQMYQLYGRLLPQWASSRQARTRVLLWVREKDIDPLLGILRS